MPANVHRIVERLRKRGNSGDDTGSTPRWVMVLVIVVIVLVLLFVALHLAGFNPGVHTP